MSTKKRGMPNGGLFFYEQQQLATISARFSRMKLAPVLLTGREVEAMHGMISVHIDCGNIKCKQPTYTSYVWTDGEVSGVTFDAAKALKDCLDEIARLERLLEA